MRKTIREIKSSFTEDPVSFLVAVPVGLCMASVISVLFLAVIINGATKDIFRPR